MAAPREGNLEAPTRHPIDWKNPQFYDENAVLIETTDVWWMMNHYESHCQEHGIPINPKLYL